MGYTHYWYRPLAIDSAVYRNIGNDFNKVVLELDNLGVRLGDGGGAGVPEISDGEINFNGLAACGHAENAAISIPWPTVNAGGIKHSMVSEAGMWFAGTLLDHRCCNGDCSYESFVFPREAEVKKYQARSPDGLQFDCCKTAFRPYDLAVTAFLIIAKRHLKDQISVSSDGEDQHWEDARRLCQSFLGYGVEYHLGAAGDDGETLQEIAPNRT